MAPIKSIIPPRSPPPPLGPAFAPITAPGPLLWHYFYKYSIFTCHLRASSLGVFRPRLVYVVTIREPIVAKKRPFWGPRGVFSRDWPRGCGPRRRTAHHHFCRVTSVRPPAGSDKSQKKMTCARGGRPPAPRDHEILSKNEIWAVPFRDLRCLGPIFLETPSCAP